ncbi:hypothetical protein ACJMK2_031542 [Sinanodonta woodiana]|uniref:Uncharacterized protein n=1 Tax=Sinanodonta woodiana TaxID=1069815 RepID=A0ABD3X0W9_SINWO
MHCTTCKTPVTLQARDIAPFARLQAHHDTSGHIHCTACETPGTSRHFRPQILHHLRDSRHIMTTQAKDMMKLARFQAHHDTSWQDMAPFARLQAHHDTSSNIHCTTCEIPCTS